MSYNVKDINQARAMRQNGFSLKEISSKLGVSKSTASLWTAKVILNKGGNKRIIDRQNKARLKAFNTISKNREIVWNEIKRRANVTLIDTKLSPHLNKLLLSFLVWTEGDKKLSHLGFANSDPDMIYTFLFLLRNAFKLDEKRLRGLVHVHEYHNEKEVLNFWSKTTNIPLSQFTKSYLKPHTGKRIKDNYMGSMHVRYYDYQVARELAYIYNMFAKKLRGVG